MLSPGHCSPCAWVPAGSHLHGGLCAHGSAALPAHLPVLEGLSTAQHSAAWTRWGNSPVPAAPSCPQRHVWVDIDPAQPSGAVWRPVQPGPFFSWSWTSSHCQHWLTRGSPRDTLATLPGCPLSHLARDLRPVIPHKTPSPAPASLPGATASPAEPAQLMPLSWHGAPAEPGAPPRLGRAGTGGFPLAPTLGSAVPLRLVAQSPVGSWGTGPGGATAQLPSQSRLPPWKAPGARRCCGGRARGAVRSQQQLRHSLALPFPPSAQRGLSVSPAPR